MRAAMTSKIRQVDLREREERPRVASTVDGEKRLTVAEAADEARVSIHTVRRGYENHHLRIQRFGIGGRGIRIRRADLLAWMEDGGRTDVMEPR